MAVRNRGLILVGFFVAGAALMSGRAASAYVQLSVQPTSGQAGSQARVSGRGFHHRGCPKPSLFFIDSAGTATFLRETEATFSLTVTIPDQAAPGLGKFMETVRHYNRFFQRCIIYRHPTAEFTVTQ